jgi:hypothetical protein
MVPLVICKNFIRVVLVFIALPAMASPKGKNSGDEHGAISRVAEIYEVEHLEDHRIRVIFSAQEREGAQRFPITTIDRSMVKVDFTNTSTAPAEAGSLLLHGAGGNDLRRALYVGFSLHRKLNARAIEELRSDVGQLLKDLPSEFLTVAAIAQDSARVIADVSPDKGDNVNRILQQLQSLAPEGEGPALADTLCVAAERFHAWDLSKFKKSDQKVLVIVSNPGDALTTERYRGQNCWRSLLDQGVRVFSVAFGPEIGRSTFDLTDVAPESGGYVHHVSGPVEMGAAIKNIIALLKNEYVIDVNAPDIAIEDQPLELKLRISYHDEIFESANYNVGFVIPNLAKVFASGASGHQNAEDDASKKEAVEAQARLHFLLIILVVSSFVAILIYCAVRYLKMRSRTTDCNTCGLRVARDHADCPFRQPDCVARLVVVSGRYAGQTIPILKGETRFARFPVAKAAKKIRGRGIRWRHHGTITLDGQKVLYTPAKLGRDRVNGWKVYEPRLLGVGSVLTIGDQMLRFEIKPQFSRQ